MIYKVGGAVRDKLLGRPVTDQDWVVVGATPEELLEQGYQPVGKGFPVFLHPHTREEYALARTERKVAPGYKGFVFHAAPEVTLEEDLRRRDVTINAMAEDTEGRVLDPFGGQADLAQGVLRHISPAFAEDPVRILRVARFAARFGFRVAEETAILMRAMVESGEVDALVSERVWAETEKALGEPKPRLFLEVLRHCGALARLFPEIERLFGVPQPAEHHPEIDTGDHTLRVLDQAVRLSPDPRVRFAALTHDLGKGLTPPEEWPRHHGHEGRSVELVQGLCRRYRIPNDYQDLAVQVARHHGNCHRAQELRPGTLLDLLKAVDAFRRPERFQQFLLACEADARGRTGFEDRAYPQAEFLRQALAAANRVQARELLAQGLSGEALGRALEDRRTQAIAEWRRQADPSITNRSGSGQN
jgi:tRNA nucleotidyltransferase (CCA-adding enzyme)